MDELRTALYSNGGYSPENEEKLKRVIEEVDPNGDNRIDRAEFERLMALV